MKIRTVLVAGIAAGIGYVMGTAAGRARFEQLRGQAKDFLGSPQVQDTVANLSDTVKQNTSKLPDPVAGVVNAVADKAKGATGGQTTSEPGATPSTSDLSETLSTSDLPETPVGDYPETPESLSISDLSDTPLSDYPETSTVDPSTSTMPRTTPPPTPSQ